MTAGNQTPPGGRSDAPVGPGEAPDGATRVDQVDRDDDGAQRERPATPLPPSVPARVRMVARNTPAAPPSSMPPRGPASGTSSEPVSLFEPVTPPSPPREAPPEADVSQTAPTLRATPPSGGSDPSGQQPGETAPAVHRPADQQESGAASGTAAPSDDGSAAPATGTAAPATGTAGPGTGTSAPPAGTAVPTTGAAVPGPNDGQASQPTGPAPTGTTPAGTTHSEAQPIGFAPIGAAQSGTTAPPPPGRTAPGTPPPDPLAARTGSDLRAVQADAGQASDSHAAGSGRASVDGGQAPGGAPGPTGRAPGSQAPASQSPPGAGRALGSGATGSHPRAGMRTASTGADPRVAAPAAGRPAPPPSVPARVTVSSRSAGAPATPALPSREGAGRLRRAPVVALVVLVLLAGLVYVGYRQLTGGPPEGWRTATSPGYELAVPNTWTPPAPGAPPLTVFGVPFGTAAQAGEYGCRDGRFARGIAASALIAVPADVGLDQAATAFARGAGEALYPGAGPQVAVGTPAERQLSTVTGSRVEATVRTDGAGGCRATDATLQVLVVPRTTAPDGSIGAAVLVVAGDLRGGPPDPAPLAREDVVGVLDTAALAGA